MTSLTYWRLTAPALVLAFLGCSSEGPLSYSIVSACLRVPEAQQRVFRTAEEWASFYAAHRSPSEGPAPAVDFGRFVVAAHFDGTGSACVGFTLDSVRLEEGRVVIRATRHVSPNPCIAVVAYPQLIVAVERKDLPVLFRIGEARDEVEADTRACF